MLHIDSALTPADLSPAIDSLWELSAQKWLSIEDRWDPTDGAPVFTVDGKYTSRGWTDWTQGFQFGSGLIQFDATGDDRCLERALNQILKYQPAHVTHFGVHDHGFNVVSTYGRWWKLIRSGKVEATPNELAGIELAIKASGSVQASRWTDLGDGLGFIHSFNGPHSLFIDTVRTLRVLSLAHQLGHRTLGEADQPISLLGRLIQHGLTTASYAVFYGDGRDRYDDKPGRVAHESLFNTKAIGEAAYRCPATQQGYSPFTTWTRGLAWAICGFAEQLEWLDTIDPGEVEETFDGAITHDDVVGAFREAAEVTSDFYLAEMPTDGVPYWDTGAPRLHELGDYQDRPAEPLNDIEPVDSSAAAIAAQGLIRLGRWLDAQGSDGAMYVAAGLTVTRALLAEPYLSTDTAHEGLLLHTVYHEPNGWDHNRGRNESCQWGDYHLRELALYVQRLSAGSDERFYG